MITTELERMTERYGGDVACRDPVRENDRSRFSGPDGARMQAMGVRLDTANTPRVEVAETRVTRI